ncbi:hypothetical protein [Streptosporangium sp. 'caverna']|uniref:hypothetical protein n=1 Tax=Streptosporangium sp. 'caverna' TaxID=2202249 RepID=UPI000D7E15B2|nr:hypothetical protein [Streptosporangium sp. 'caverna']AWS46709.1 hypothetical protein DKM19_40850 [Streptosporangium sp. 'caverna']
MNFSLSDLVPPLRWSDAATISLLRDQPDLPDAWWRSLPMSRVLAVLGPERLAEILSEIALRHWPAASVGDILPALHVLDPEEADEPCTAIALDRTGSWPGLLALTGHDLRDQPFIQPLPVLNALFTAAFARLVTPAPASSPMSAVAFGRRAEAPESEESLFGARAAVVPATRAVAAETGAELHEAAPAREPQTADAGAGSASAAGDAEHPEARPSAAPETVFVAKGKAGPLPGAALGSAAKAAEPKPEPEAVPVLDADPAPVLGAAPASEAGPTAGKPAGKATAEPEPEAGALDAPESKSAAEASRQPARKRQAEANAVSAGDVPKARLPVENLHALVDGIFANIEDKRWAVAQNRLFSDAPAALEALANLFAVPPEVIQDLEADLRRELKEWLASDEAAPYRDHLDRVKKVIGKAAPRERLINAADWHSRELHSLDVPAWQFVLATLPDYHLVDEWLVEGDIAELRHRTRDMISSAKSPLTINKALDMVSSLGIHPEVSKEWLENVPQLRILGAGERPPQRSNGSAAPAKPAPRGAKQPPALSAGKPAPKATERLSNGSAGLPPAVAAEPVPGEPAGRPPAVAEHLPSGPAEQPEPEERPVKEPFRPLKDVSLTRRCFRQPDGRWWLRIDVTPEHIQGAECPLPSGFAAYLGMSPGVGRTVNSAVGELALSWQDRPVLESLRTLLDDVGAKEGSHLFLTLSDEGVLRARHLPAAAKDADPTAHALRLVGYTAAGGTHEQACRVIATRVGMTGPVGLPDLLIRLRERGDRDLLSLLA